MCISYDARDVNGVCCVYGAWCGVRIVLWAWVYTVCDVSCGYVVSLRSCCVLCLVYVWCGGGCGGCDVRVVGGVYVMFAVGGVCVWRVMYSACGVCVLYVLRMLCVVCAL